MLTSFPTPTAAAWPAGRHAGRSLPSRSRRLQLSSGSAFGCRAASTSLGNTLFQQTTAESVAGVPVGDLLVTCADQKGVVAALAQLLFGYGCNIISSDQYTDQEEQVFFQRIRFSYDGLIVGRENINVLENAMSHTATKFNMTWRMHLASKLKRVIIMVSTASHCLYDLLIRHQAGELSCEIVAIVSNHSVLQPIAEQFGVPFHHLPIDKAMEPAAAKAAQELAVEALFEQEQILSTGFCERNSHRTINIHHSFLPAFEGAKPYHKAHKRGVKLIGATAHYATAELDAGPIIEQDVVRVTHRETVQNMVRKGKDLERTVLASAVRAHLENRVLVWNNRTVVFED